jgi:hypothetical protein
MLRAMRARTERMMADVKPSALLIAGLLTLVASGCAYGEVRQVLRAQFASELNCPEVSMRRRDTWYAYEGPEQYKISGCGVMRTYTCPDTKGLVSYGSTPCTFVNGDADAPQGPKAEPNPVDESAPQDAEPTPSSDDSSSESSSSSSDSSASSSSSSSDGLDGTDISSESSSESKGSSKKAGGKVKASTGIKLGH